MEARSVVVVLFSFEPVRDYGRLSKLLDDWVRPLLTIITAGFLAKREGF